MLPISSQLCFFYLGGAFGRVEDGTCTVPVVAVSVVAALCDGIDIGP